MFPEFLFKTTAHSTAARERAPAMALGSSGFSTHSPQASTPYLVWRGAGTLRGMVTFSAGRSGAGRQSEQSRLR